MRVLLNGPEKRLDAIAVSHGDEILCLLVEQHNRELSAEIVHKVQAMVHVERDDYLAVTVAAENIICGVFKLLAYAIVVVEFSVDDGVDLAIGRVEGLGSVGRKVIDGESYMTES